MAVWNDAAFLVAGKQMAEPFTPSYVNPGSYDLCLGDRIRPAHPVWGVFAPAELRALTRGELPGWLDQYLEPAEMDAVITASDPLDALPHWGKAVNFTTYVLMPGEFVLCHTQESVKVPDDCIALLFSKSSTGRRGIEHSHAGLADPGFEGEWTLELSNVAPWPIKLVAGQRLMQQVYIKLVAAAQTPYKVRGRYQHQHGPTPERTPRG